MTLYKGTKLETPLEGRRLPTRRDAITANALLKDIVFQELSILQNSNPDIVKHQSSSGTEKSSNYFATQ